MSNVFYTSDLHFNHPFVAGTRDYDTAEEHDEALIERFNKVIRKRDHVWILGDLGMGSLTDVLKQASRLNGIKHLVYGNHDPGHPMHKRSHNKQRRYLEVFESASVQEQHIIGGRTTLLSHFPYDGDHYHEDRHTQWRLRDKGEWLLCGHVHHAWPSLRRQINVGVDFANVPIPREWIDEFMAEEK